MIEVTRGRGAEIIIRVEGAFDAGAASTLTRRLAELPRDDVLVIDFTQVRSCDDLDLASIAGTLGARPSLVVRGLTRHQERVLRYLGVRLENANALGASEDADTVV